MNTVTFSISMPAWIASGVIGALIVAIVIWALSWLFDTGNMFSTRRMSFGKVVLAFFFVLPTNLLAFWLSYDVGLWAGIIGGAVALTVSYILLLGAYKVGLIRNGR